MSLDENQSLDGVLFHLDREHAKRLFGLRDDGELTAFVQELVPRLPAEDVVHLGDAWKLLNQCMSETTADVDVSRLPQAQMIAGGRPLGPGQAIMVRMVRPDLVAMIASEADGLATPSLIERMSRVAAEEAIEPSVALDLLEQAGKLYQRAAAAHGAVVFAAIP